MKFGLSAGILWALDTVILGIALGMAAFCSTPEALLLAPFVSCLFHDGFSVIYTTIYLALKKELKAVFQSLKSSGGKFIILAALFEGPIGMCCYVLSINYIGPTYAAIISATFPALGTLFSYLFLKEKITKHQVLGLLICIFAVILLGYSPEESAEVKNFYLGFLFAIITCIGWASEAVACTYAMQKSPEITNEHVLLIRAVTTTLIYGVVILNVLKGWNFAISIIGTPEMYILAIAGISITLFYLCYYKSLSLIGASKTLALDITYSAWTIVFSFLILHVIPDMKSVICCLLIICGTIISSTNLVPALKERFSK